MKKPDQLFLPGLPKREKTLREARAEILANRDNGIDCPCCGRHCKIYRRRVHAAMAACLIELYKAKEVGPVDSSYIAKRLRHLDTSHPTGDLSKLAFWDLIHETPGDPTDEDSPSAWAITEKGESFVERRSTVVKYAFVYLDQVLEFDGEQVSIDDALGNRFSFDEIMGR